MHWDSKVFSVTDLSQAIYCQHFKINGDEPATVLCPGDTRMNMIDMPLPSEITLYYEVPTIRKTIT